MSVDEEPLDMAALNEQLKGLRMEEHRKPLDLPVTREFRQDDGLMPPLTAEDMQRIIEAKCETPEDMAEVMGVSVSDVAEVVQAQIAFYRELAEKLQQRFTPSVRPNRVQRRLAQGKGPKRMRG